FMVTGSQLHFMPTLFDVRDVLIGLLMAAAATIVAHRYLRGARAARRAHSPVLVLAIANLAFIGMFTLARALTPRAKYTEIVGLAAMAVLPALVFAFVAGLLRLRVVARSAQRRLTPGSAGMMPPSRIRDVLADAI